MTEPDADYHKLLRNMATEFLRADIDHWRAVQEAEGANKRQNLAFVELQRTKEQLLSFAYKECVVPFENDAVVIRNLTSSSKTCSVLPLGGKR